MVAFATQVKRRRGTAEQNNEFTGAEGEIVVNLTDKSLRVHDGQTKGGFETLRQNMQNSVNITNCITEIPQDIQLELNNGTLTLKAGSKVYVPNGFESDGTTPKFDEVTISTDKQNTTSTSTSGTGVVFYNTISNTLFFKWDNQVSSGTSDITNYIVYRTDLNKISDGGAYGRSFPLGIITVTSGTITSIDQVFNGFGYIGSTVFALSGVKGLVPNGRNADGTLKNVSWTTSSIILRTYSTAYSGEYDIFFNGGSLGALKKTYVYDEESNYNMDSNNRYNSTYIGRAYITSGTISYFATKNAFHAVDYSEYKNTIDWVRTQTSNVVRLVEEQKTTSENNYTWYRKYDNGLVEQGGIHHRGSAGDTVNLPIAMSNEYYELQLTAVNPTNINRYAYANSYTSTYFKCGTADDQSPNNDGDIRWYVCGYAAS